MKDPSQLACWISGFFFWLFALYLVYAILVYHKLLWYTAITILIPHLTLIARARRPWDREAWGGVRKAADDVLRKGKVGEMMMMMLTTTHVVAEKKNWKSSPPGEGRG